MPYKDPDQDLAWRRARYAMKAARRQAWLREVEYCPTCGEPMRLDVGPRADRKSCYHFRKLRGVAAPEFSTYPGD